MPWKKTSFRLEANIVIYRDYQDFVNDYFLSELLQKISVSDPGKINFEDWHNILQRELA